MSVMSPILRWLSTSSQIAAEYARIDLTVVGNGGCSCKRFHQVAGGEGGRLWLSRVLAVVTGGGLLEHTAPHFPLYVGPDTSRRNAEADDNFTGRFKVEPGFARIDDTDTNIQIGRCASFDRLQCPAMAAGYAGDGVMNEGVLAVDRKCKGNIQVSQIPEQLSLKGETVGVDLDIVESE